MSAGNEKGGTEMVTTEVQSFKFNERDEKEVG